MNLKLIKILPLFLLISGCVSNAQIDKMNNGTNAALGKPLTGLINVIGDPHETIQIGDYNLEGGSIQYLTLNTNAKSKNSSANAYFYTRGESTVSEIVFNGNLTGSTNGAVAGGGIIDSGSGYTQGTNSIIVGSLGTVSSLDGNGGAVFPIIDRPSSKIILELFFFKNF